jgi:hypothetical protein
MKERQVAVTTRLALELQRLRASAPDDPSALVFGILDNVKRSFTAARTKAGLKDLRFHDLRTRQQRGLSVLTFRYQKLAASWATLRRIRLTVTSTRMWKWRSAQLQL